MAWSDRPWVLDGAAVHISIVGFDDGTQTHLELDGEAIDAINADLSTGVDLTKAIRLTPNLGIAFMGDTKGGPFDIPESIALDLLKQPNPDGRNNHDVVRPRFNGQDITSRPSNTYIIDFGVDLPITEAALYEAPFEYVNTHVRPEREKSRSEVCDWWLHERPRPAMRQSLERLAKYIATPTTAQHRLFCWLPTQVLPDHSLIAIARDDDYAFGVLHSQVHQLWALKAGTQLETRPRYTPTTCFETFPFPKPSDAQRQVIADAAKELNERREGWLNPPGLPEKELKKRTLTNLYNDRPTWLQHAHKKLDQAVLDAYGWPHDLTDAAILERLLALNLERAEKQGH